MCGVFGVIRPDGIRSADELTFAAIGNQLKHRGPDGDGYIEDAQALLGMHRLSIMDVDHGWQPFWSEDSRVGVLGNGEIYNAAELRRGLLERGHILRTRSDIEVVAHLYEESGIDSVSRLRGMFALVVRDIRSNEIVLVRDRLGEKPLSYLAKNGAFYFSSEQSALAKAGVFDLHLDEDALTAYLLHGFVPEPVSIIHGVRKVPAAHVLRIDVSTGESHLHQYWNSLDFADSKDLSTEETANAITDAVIAACASDVPVGIALSGGLDSSMIAAIASRHRTDIQAFTVGYDEEGFDESANACEFAAELGMPCHRSTLSTLTIAREFGEICSIRDEPISDIAGPALAALPRAAREAGVPVLMTGVGGDELFWGYEWIRHLAAWTTAYSNPSAPRTVWNKIGITRPPTTLQGLTAWGLGLGGIQVERDLTAFMRRWSTPDKVPLPLYEFQYGYRRIVSQIRALTTVETDFPAPEFFGSTDAAMKGAEYTWASNETYLRVNSLTQIDRLSMHYSVESRTPFADHRLLETIMSGRVGLNQVDEPTKFRQRAVAKELLPEHVLNRPKRGFTPPVRKWARAIWREHRPALQIEAIAAHSSLNADAARSAVRRPVDRLGRVDQMALRLMTLELWLRSLS